MTLGFIFMSRKTRIIECQECSFEGKLSYSEKDFSPSDISYCPACGGDISEVYNIADEELVEE